MQCTQGGSFCSDGSVVYSPVPSSVRPTVYGNTTIPSSSSSVVSVRSPYHPRQRVILGKSSRIDSSSREECTHLNSPTTPHLPPDMASYSSSCTYFAALSDFPPKPSTPSSLFSSEDDKKDDTTRDSILQPESQDRRPMKTTTTTTTTSTSSTTTGTTTTHFCPHTANNHPTTKGQPSSSVYYPINCCEASAGELYKWLQSANRTGLVDVFIGTPVAFYLESADWQACALVCKLWHAELLTFAKLQFFYQYGIGQEISTRRPFIWRMLLLGEDSFCSTECYEKLSRQESEYDGEIRRDIGRTFPHLPLFQGVGSEGQMRLLRVLRTCSLQFPDIGYCQGMNFLAATLLVLFDELTAYRALLSLLVRYNLREFFIPSFPKLKVAVFQFDRIVEAFLPTVFHKLSSFGLRSDFYATHWFMTLFSYDFSFPGICLIWDQFLLKGWKVIFKLGLAFLYSIQPELLIMQYDEALKFLKVFPRCSSLSAGEALRLGERFAVTTRMLEALERVHRTSQDAVVICLKDLDTNAVVWEVQAFHHPRDSETDAEGSTRQILRTHTTGCMQVRLPLRNVREEKRTEENETGTKSVVGPKREDADKESDETSPTER